MKIGVISDSHGMLEYVDIAMTFLEDVDLIIHAGDNYSDGKYIEEEYNIKVIGVSGNCDPYGIEEQVEIINGKNVFISHGHFYDVKRDLNPIFYAGKEENADLVIFGHTHVPYCSKEENMILLNPGSVSMPRGGSSRSCCIVTIDQDIKVDFIDII